MVAAMTAEANMGWGKSSNIKITAAHSYTSRNTYYNGETTLCTPRDLIEFIDETDNQFFRLILINPADPEVDHVVRFKRYLKFKEKAYILRTLSDLAKTMQDGADKSKLLDKIERIKHSGIYIFPKPKVVDLSEAVIQPPLKEFEQPLSLNQLKYRLSQKYGREYSPATKREDNNAENDSSSNS